MTIPELAKTLEKLGCPLEKSAVMAAQLDRRARMDAERTGMPYEATIEHLAGLMAQGWVASPRPKEREKKTCNT